MFVRLHLPEDEGKRCLEMCSFARIALSTSYKGTTNDRDVVNRKLLDKLDKININHD